MRKVEDSLDESKLLSGGENAETVGEGASPTSLLSSQSLFAHPVDHCRPADLFKQWLLEQNGAIGVSEYSKGFEPKLREYRLLSDEQVVDFSNGRFLVIMKDEEIEGGLTRQVSWRNENGEKETVTVRREQKAPKRFAFGLRTLVSAPEKGYRLDLSNNDFTKIHKDYFFLNEAPFPLPIHAVFFIKAIAGFKEINLTNCNIIDFVDFEALNKYLSSDDRFQPTVERILLSGNHFEQLPANQLDALKQILSKNNDAVIIEGITPSSELERSLIEAPSLGP